MPEQHNSYPVAGLVRRLLAIIYDSLLLLGVAFAYGVLVWTIRKLTGGNPMEPLSGVAAVAELSGLYLALAGYYVLCWIKRGQTLGMKSWRLRVQTNSGAYLSPAKALCRCLLAVVSALPLGLGYLWCLFDKKHGCWHDRWSDSRVVVLPKIKG